MVYIQRGAKQGKIKIEKDIYVRDEYGVRRRAFLAGDIVPSYVFETVTTKNEVVNTEDLPKNLMEIKVLDNEIEIKIADEVKVEQEIKDSEPLEEAEDGNSEEEEAPKPQNVKKSNKGKGKNK